MQTSKLTQYHVVVLSLVSFEPCLLGLHHLSVSCATILYIYAYSCKQWTPVKVDVIGLIRRLSSLNNSFVHMQIGSCLIKFNLNYSLYHFETQFISAQSASALTNTHHSIRIIQANHLFLTIFIRKVSDCLNSSAVAVGLDAW